MPIPYHHPWRFDASVAAEFDVHARQNIPGYEAVVATSVSVARAHCAPAARIVEIGSATGYTLRTLESAGFTNVLGVEKSPEMIARCRVQRAEVIESDTFPVERGPFDLALINWTLHFIPPADRAAYLQAACSALAPDGLLVLTEKTRQSPLVEAQYHAWKRSQGMSADEVEAKRRSLVGVLEPLPHGWYADTLAALGFETDVLAARFGFVTWLAQRRRAAND